MSRIIQLTVECYDFPEPTWGGHSEIWLGIQKGKVVEQAVKLPSGAITFTADLRMGSEPEQGAPNFLGSYAQGTAQDRFFYLCWGWWHGGHWVGFRRAKIPLSGLTWDDLKSNRLKARVRCKNAKGEPACATLKGDHVAWSSQPD